MSEILRWYGCYNRQRGELFTPESNRHPAKMAVLLCFRIFDYGHDCGYWKPGDLILDPMAGIGTTLVCGAALGYRALGVELEPDFADLCSKNIRHLKDTMRNVPDVRAMRGDARHLSEILNGECRTVNGGVASPPYSESHIANPRDQELARQGGAREIGTSATGHGGKGRHGYQYSHDSEAQIGNLRDPKGEIDAVLSSPPYQNSDAVNQSASQGPAFDRLGRSCRPGSRLAKSEAQIGRMRREAYLSAMLRVYQQLHKVLKRNGFVCLVTKNPIKGGKIRRLDEDTIRLMEAAGFTLIERIQAMLAEDLGEQMTLDGGSASIRREHKSFFKRLLERKRPELRVDHEDVMFFRKEA